MHLLVAHLILFHSHLAFVSVAMESSGDLPHPLTRSDPLDKVGWEKSHLVSAFPLVNTTPTNIRPAGIHRYVSLCSERLFRSYWKAKILNAKHHFLNKSVPNGAIKIQVYSHIHSKQAKFRLKVN